MATNVINVLIFCVHLIAVLLCFILVLNIWYHWYAVGIKVANATIIILSMTAMMLYIILSSLLTIGAAQIFDILLLSDLSGPPLWGLAQIFTYLVFLNRFKLSFENTKYALAKWIYYVYYVILVVYISVHCGTSTIFVLQKIAVIPVNDYVDSLIIMFIFTLIGDLMLSISLLWLFMSKLVVLHMDIGPAPHQNSKQNAVIHVMSKMSILTTCSVFSCQILIFWLAINNICFRFGVIEEQRYLQNLYILFIFWGVQNMLDALCIYMSFEFGANLYDKVCGKMHNCFVVLCKKWTRHKTIQIKTKQLELPLLDQSL